MADKKISALTPATTPLAGTEVLPIVQGGTTVKVSAADITAGRNIGATSVTAAAGSVSAPSYTFTGSTTTGLFSPAANVTAFVSNGTESARMLASGNFTIGATTGAGFRLNVDSGTANEVARFKGAANGYVTVTDGTGALRLQMSSSAPYIYSTGAYPVIFGSNSVEAFRIDTNQNIVMTTAGKGIDFSANTHAPGMTSELLNDYEEGTFTPTISSVSGAITSFTVNAARYTKIGRVVHIVVQLAVTDNGTGAGAIAIGGFPYAAAVSTCGAVYNQSTGAMGSVFISASATDGFIHRYDGTYPVATGQTLQINLTYST